MTPFADTPLTTREDETLTDTTVHLDGNLFVRCRIERCEVVFSGELNWGHFDTKFIECSFVFGARAQHILDSAAFLLGGDGWITLFNQLSAAADTPTVKH